jgi:membrane-associated phospholipid phosphatase
MQTMATAHPSLADPSGRHARAGSRVPPGLSTPLYIAGACAVAFVLTWVVAALLPPTHFKDAVALHDLTLLRGAWLGQLAEALLEPFDPFLYALWSMLLVLVALMRARARVALAVAVVLLTAPALAEALKPVLAHQHAAVEGRTPVGPASWPSGHATAVTVLVMCAVLVAPRRLRPALAVLGAIFIALVGFSVVVLALHMPSDVLGGYLLGTLCVALAIAALRVDEASAGVRRA